MSENTDRQKAILATARESDNATIKDALDTVMVLTLLSESDRVNEKMEWYRFMRASYDITLTEKQICAMVKRALKSSNHDAMCALENFIDVAIENHF